MTKTRVKQVGNIFYPQWSPKLFKWWNFYEELDGFEHYSVVAFNSKEKAINYAKEHMPKIVWESKE
jgi:hypothetical protein